MIFLSVEIIFNFQNEKKKIKLNKALGPDLKKISGMKKILQTVRENADIFINASKDIGLEVNSEKTKYMITSRHQNVVQNQYIY